MKKVFLIAIILVASVLRLYKLGSIPPSLYWDEASLGYNAYSILISARDEHGKFLPLINFAAFGDYKPPGYIYATVPVVAIFGLSDFAIRFPSAFFGILTVLLTYFLTKKLFVEKYHRYEKYERYEKQYLNLTSRTSGTSRTFSTSETIALLSAL